MTTKTLTETHTQLAKLLDDFDAGTLTSVDVIEQSGGSVVAKLVSPASYAAKAALSGNEENIELPQSVFVRSANKMSNLYRLSKTIDVANAISDKAIAASLTRTISGGNKITFTADVKGTGGNALSVVIINPGSDGALTAVQSGTVLTVTLAYATGAPTSTIDTVVAAVNALTTTKKITAAPVGTGSTLVTAMASTALTGGLNANSTSNATLLDAISNDNRILFTSDVPGNIGNALSVVIVDPGSDGALSVDQTGDVLTITLAYATGAPTSTITTVVAAVNAVAVGTKKITATPFGTGSTLVPAMSSTLLLGGRNAPTAPRFKAYKIYRKATNSRQVGFDPANTIRAVLISKTHADHLGL